jgi:GT2 family glycosyltransferase
VICNNDLEFHPLFCSELLSLAQDDRVFAICPDVVTSDGKHQNPHLLESVPAFRRFQFDVYFSHFYIACVLLFIRRLFRRLLVAQRPSIQERREIHMGVGACYVLTENYFAHFENLECPVFLYGEEVFMSEQIHSKGGVLMYEPRLKVNHAESAALSRIPKRARYEYERKSYPLYRSLM